MARKLSSVFELNRKLSFMNPYVGLVHGQYKKWCLDVDQCAHKKGNWRQGLNANQQFLDLEIGTGIGHHFSRYVFENQNRMLLGMELKYKLMIQTVKRALLQGSDFNFLVFRQNAQFISEIFSESELDNVYIHFPDPWPKKRMRKNRLIQESFIKDLFSIQRDGSLLEIKTDSSDYFEQCVDVIEASPYKVVKLTWDLYSDQDPNRDHLTKFERIFVEKNHPVKMLICKKLGT